MSTSMCWIVGEAVVEGRLLDLLDNIHLVLPGGAKDSLFDLKPGRELDKINI